MSPASLNRPGGGRDQCGAGVQAAIGSAMNICMYDSRFAAALGAAVGLFLSVGPLAAAVPSQPAAAAVTLDDAWRACNARKLSAADRIAHCTTIIQSTGAKRTARAQALMGRGFGFIAQKDLGRALADFDAAIKQNPKLAAAYYYRGAILTPSDPDGRSLRSTRRSHLIRRMPTSFASAAPFMPNARIMRVRSPT